MSPIADALSCKEIQASLWRKRDEKQLPETWLPPLALQQLSPTLEASWTWALLSINWRTCQADSWVSENLQRLGLFMVVVNTPSSTTSKVTGHSPLWHEDWVCPSGPLLTFSSSDFISCWLYKFPTKPHCSSSLQRCQNSMVPSSLLFLRLQVSCWLRHVFFFFFADKNVSG